MPLAENIHVTENLVINFSSRCEAAQYFSVIVANRGKQSVNVKKISSSLDFVDVLNFNESNSVINANAQISYLFVAKHEQQISSDLNEGKIRFTFMNHTHVTRSFKIVRESIETESMLPKIADTENDDTDPTKALLTPGIINLQGFIKSDYDNWLNQFDEKNPLAIEITDNLHIEFDHFQSSPLCVIRIRNNTWKNMCLSSIEMDKSMITMCEQFNGKSMTIGPRGDLKLHFRAEFDSKKFSGQTQIGFWFGKVCLLRTITIQYRKRGSALPKNEYAIPDTLNDVIVSRYRISRSEYMDALDKWIPSPDVDYAKHFHNLLYLEEYGLREEIKRNYFQKEAFFSDQEYLVKDGKTIREKYERGIYDLEIKDLFEIRPSLQPNDKVIARKHSALDVVYKGEVILLKEKDLLCVQFKDDFVENFDNKAYVVEFDFSRNFYVRMHCAIDMATNIFGMSILKPEKIIVRKKPQIDVRLSKEPSNFKLTKNGKPLEWYNEELNDNQRETVANILRGDILNPYIIHGPPGTGKTTTLTELILQIVKHVKNSRIVVATQSNSAANIIVQRLARYKEVNSKMMLRLISRNYAVKSSAMPEEIVEFVKQIDDLMPESEPNYYKCLAKLQNYKVVIGTSSTIANLLGSIKLQNTFTHAMIDEAGQSTEPSVLVPMVLVGKAGQIVMAGDQLQMQPLCFDLEANARGLPIPMIKRLSDWYENIKTDHVIKQRTPSQKSPIFKLIHNYRSLPSILQFYNSQFYESKLLAMIDSKTSSDAEMLARFNRIFVDANQSNDYGIHFVDVNGKNVVRKHSWANILETQVIEIIVDWMMTRGLNSNDIGIIAPYILQVRALEHRIKKYPDIKVGTVEEFQGLERKIILISTTRTCPGGMKIDVSRHLGFVKCPKRINVAVSRARAMVVVVGKGELLSADDNWNALIEGCKKHGTYISTKKPIDE